MPTFTFKDCALAVVTTGESASSLPEMRDLLLRVSVDSIYFHFWGGRLRPTILQTEYLNDFARWSHFCLHDDVLAERLSIVDPTGYKGLEEVRQALIEIIETRIDESDTLIWLPKRERFRFLHSTIVVFDTSITVSHPQEWKSLMPSLSINSLFYHFIDARKRTPHATDDFSFWLEEFGDEYKEVIEKIRAIDSYLFTLTELRQRLCDIITRYFP